MVDGVWVRTAVICAFCSTLAFTDTAYVRNLHAGLPRSAYTGDPLSPIQAGGGYWFGYRGSFPCERMPAAGAPARLKPRRHEART